MNRPDVLVASSAHDVGDARLHRIVAALANADLGVTVHAHGDPAHAPRGVRVERASGRGWAGRLLVSATILRRPARVLMVLDPELAVTARLWRALHRRPVVADVHEDYLAVVHDRAWIGPWLRGLVTLLVRGSVNAAASCDLTVVADEHVPPRSARHRIVARNIPSLDELPGPAETDTTPRALYVGDLRRSRGLFEMVTAVLAVDGWSIDLVGPISAADRAAVLAQATRAGGSDRVRLRGRLPLEQAWQYASGAWVGLAILHDTPAFRQAVPTKLYEYVGSGLPVLVTDLPPLRRFVERTAAGVVVGTEDEVAARLRDWRDDPAALASLRESALSARSILLADSPYEQLADEISRLVTSPRKVAT